MALQEELKVQGDYLFRHRSFLPIIILVIGMAVFIVSEYERASLAGTGISASHNCRCSKPKPSINDQWRICFEWQNGNAYKVEIVDYHWGDTMRDSPPIHPGEILLSDNLSVVQHVWWRPPTLVTGLFPPSLRAREQATGKADSSGQGESWERVEKTAKEYLSVPSRCPGSLRKSSYIVRVLQTSGRPH